MVLSTSRLRAFAQFLVRQRKVTWHRRALLDPAPCAQRPLPVSFQPDTCYPSANKPLKVIIDKLYQYAIMFSLGRQDLPPPLQPCAPATRFFSLLQKLDVCPGLLAKPSIRSVQRIHCPLPTIALSSLAATLMDHLANVANKRLTAKLSSLDATLT